MNNILSELTDVLETRKSQSADSSYVSSLHQKGLNKILEKIGEESTETIIAAKEGDKTEIVKETADLWFHTLVMLSHLDLSADDVLAELERRFGLSGIEEKASRNQYTYQFIKPPILALFSLVLVKRETLKRFCVCSYGEDHLRRTTMAQIWLLVNCVTILLSQYIAILHLSKLLIKTQVVCKVNLMRCCIYFAICTSCSSNDIARQLLF